MSNLLGELGEIPKRTEVADLIASRDMWDLSHLNTDLPDMARFDVSVTIRDDPPLVGELYVPQGDGDFGALVYLHGGGWCAGSAANERKIAMRLAETGCVVLNVEYRLAPEHPFPAALEDSVYACRWLAEYGTSFGASEGAIAIGGQSAGANLAAATAAYFSSSSSSDRSLMLDYGLGDTRVNLGALILLSGIYSFPMLLDEPGSNVGPAELWHQAYLGSDFLRSNRHMFASPIFAALKDFPPTYISCGDEDSLLGQSLAFAKALTQADVSTTVSILADQDHGFPFLEDATDYIAEDMQRMRMWLRRQLTNPVMPRKASI